MHRTIPQRDRVEENNNNITQQLASTRNINLHEPRKRCYNIYTRYEKLNFIFYPLFIADFTNLTLTVYSTLDLDN